MSGYQRPRAETVDSTNSQDPFVSARAVRRGCGDIRGSFSNQGGAQDGKVRYTLILPPSGFFSGRPGASEPLRNLTMNGTRLPTIEVALDSTSFPFIESCTQHVPQNYGVVKITNIPFNVKEAEIVAIIGKNSKILNDTQGPIHIIMDRPSSKTEDVYVEFYTSEDAAKCVERLQKNARNGRPPRIDGRIVAVQLVDQAELMRVLFPYAKGVDWHGCDPRVIEVGADGYEHEKFRGFLTPDEMIMLVKHVEVPGRSPFSMDVPQRPFECLMSTIKKFPWHMSKHITVGQRFQIYDATIKMVTILKAKIALAAEQRQRREQLKLLFDRIVKAAMMCPGFSVVQKDNIACCAGWGELKCSKFNQPCFANEWKHLHTLCPRPTRVPIDVLDWYIAFIREHSVEQMSSRSVQERTEAEQKSQHTSDYFGYLWAELNLPEGKELNNMTLHDLYNREVNAIQRVFARVLRRGSNAQALPESEQQ
ncbi:hypothetical protein QBC44DRAFT_232199 [Cladorrhinum sp. PSN332]|nr:hypothetical protein QBC44DRAFT_232199 [Cladorrhinum sp. PSN332]